MKKEKDELKLIHKAIRGSVGAYSKLVEIHKEYFYRMAFIHTRDEQLALDVVQESIIKAYKAIGSLREESVFTTWITRIIINTARDMNRKEGRLIPMEEVPEDTHRTVPSHEEQLDVNRAVEALPELYRSVILFYYFDDLSVKEICERTGLPKNTVVTRLRRGRMKLKEILGEDYMEEKAL